MIAGRHTAHLRPARVFSVLVLLAAGAPPSPATAADFTGLWVGTATVDAVSQVHKTAPDLAFDLVLTGLTNTTPLVAFRSTGWAYTRGEAPAESDWTTGAAAGVPWSGNQSAPLYAYPSGLTHAQGTQVAGTGNTTYVRRSFTVEDPALLSGLRLLIRREDGVAVYLNGRAVYRNNLASSGALTDISEANRLVETTLPATALQTGDNWIAAEVHTLGSGDGILYFDLELSAAAETEATALIPTAATGWAYAAPENPDYPDDPQAVHPYQAPAGDWTAVGYAADAPTWIQGRTPFGYSPDARTTLSFNTAIWPRTLYFRRAFNANGGAFDQLRLELLRDDGAVVYLNGVEVLRSNLPTGRIAYDTPPAKAVGPADEGRYVVAEIAATDLLSGENVVAVEIHQHPSELGDPTAAQIAVTPSDSPFSLRLMLHNGTSGNARLLKEAYSNLFRREGDALLPVLLASDAQIPNYEGTGSRISTAAYDFAEDTVACESGTVAASGTVRCTIALPANHPTNPFLHRYHPDHDNWDPRYEKHFPDPGAPEESFAVSRTLRLTFEEKYPPGCEGATCRQYPPPGWGYSSVGGTYEEVFLGLHRDPITVTGTFKLERVSTVGELED